MDEATRALRLFAYHREALSMSWYKTKARTLKDKDPASTDDCVTVEDIGQSHAKVQVSEDHE